ncbi:MAG: flagellar hook-associated protein FlgL [Firmicutes bacterium]|nr:flagellar hook-associated protein FlgL [Bacillota bacterium]
MRVTSNMIAQGLLANLNAHLRRMEDLHHQLSSGKRLRRASDDPAATSISMRLHTSLVHTRQHRANLDAAVSWLEATDSALAEAGEVLQRAKELAVYGANDTMPLDAREALAQEVDQLLHHMIAIANTTHAGLYIFAGHKTQTPPYAAGSGTITAAPAYAGDTGLREYEIGDGVTVAVNLPGDAVFDPILQSLIDLRDNLRSGDGDAVGGQVLGDLEAALDGLLRARADVGARANRLELARARLDEMELNFEQLLSNTEDADIARVIIDLKTSENAYRAALAAGARIIQPSLIDFLR